MQIGINLKHQEKKQILTFILLVLQASFRY